jgi:hypothetical protein
MANAHTRARPPWPAGPALAGPMHLPARHNSARDGRRRPISASPPRLSPAGSFDVSELRSAFVLSESTAEVSFYGAVPKVRISPPPAVSRQRTRHCPGESGSGAEVRVSYVANLCYRWSALLVVTDRVWQPKPCVHRLLPNRVARRGEGRRVKRAHRDPADRRIAVPFPIQGAAAVRAKMKSNAIAAIGIALINLALTVEMHPRFRIGRAEMESSTRPALARLAVAQVNPFWVTRRDNSKRAAVALPYPFHVSLQFDEPALWPILAVTRRGTLRKSARAPSNETSCSSSIGWNGWRKIAWRRVI